MMLSLDTAYRSFGGEVEASSTPTICRLSDSRRHQLSAIALRPSPAILTICRRLSLRSSSGHFRQNEISGPVLLGFAGSTPLSVRGGMVIAFQLATRDDVWLPRKHPPAVLPG